MLKSAIYRGHVNHKRLLPIQHQFTYTLSMVMMDLDQLADSFKQSRWWSLEKFNLISFFRKDYLGRNSDDLKTAVQAQIFKTTGQHFAGKVFLLTQPRYLGFVFNPVSFYFCYNEKNQLAYLLADINNTPWNECHCYVLRAESSMNEVRAQFDKSFHISPFMPMDMQYDWRFHITDDQLTVHMTLFRHGEEQFHVDMTLRPQPLNKSSMADLPKRYPIQTLRIVGRIYWQAMKLWLKRVPFYTHPDVVSQTDKTQNREKS
ncbi:hypothetical protein LP43_1582 [Methylophaga thiooxydans]|uniref:DUF1365 domain-containing protein n=1 Tax=Methylophaga thiooxydans TaxID=392484 RepID=A0A0A0BGJ0_9GAMM|nr:DUF1365 domain-containing protein [Methylophaga thiooxydans]KGM07081.1 hypothetical protein LP43_1582 [Methylophaga thiooxydans]